MAERRGWCLRRTWPFLVLGASDSDDTWRRCRRAAEALDLPEPFDPVVFIRDIARQRGRVVELLPVAGRVAVPCGLLITTADADYIVYDADTTELHRRHILLHEAAHLLCGHHESEGPSAGAAALVPGLPRKLVRRVLGRSVYSDPQEREAELLASFILHRVGRDETRRRRTTALSGRQARLGWLVGAPHHDGAGPDGGTGAADG
ncbi:ParH-like protein [Streptomyces sp. NPDC048566]|uniref:ParH-like protein n=1 Tax=Streptomyces sp. NPDC048566 TaxID=3365569 RepID=UPI0037201080